MSLVDATKRLTAEEFDRLPEKTKGRTVELRDAARAVLVDGRGLQEIATKMGVSRQRVMTLRDRVYAAYLSSEMTPPGWVKATVTAPEPMLKKFAADVEKERRAYFSAKQKQ